MTLFEYITHNIDTVKTLVRVGAVPCSMMRYFSIYSRFYYWTKQGHCRSHAVAFTAEEMKITQRSVYNVIERMEGEL